MDYSQWLRYFKLTVATNEENIEAIDLSEFRVRFSISQAVLGKPTTADIFVYNVAKETVDRIAVAANSDDAIEKGLSVIIEAGYQESHSVIFKGDLWWKTVGRESETDTFMRLIASSGDRAFNYSMVNASIAKGATQEQIFDVVQKTMQEKGVSPTKMPPGLDTKLPRGKVLYGMSSKAMQSIADSNGFRWSIGSDGIIAIPKTPEYTDDSEVIILNSDTGLIGRPKLTVNGVELQCLLNPSIDVGTLIQIDNRSIQRNAYDTAVKADIMANAATTDAFVSADGIYQVYSREFVGDTRGNDWYANILCYGVNAAQRPMTPNVLNTYPNM